MSGPSDAELVAAIERAYLDGYRRFLRLAVAMLGDVERGRDAVQEAFALALRARGDLRRLDRLNGWLWRTLLNVCRAELRRPAPYPGGPEREANGHPAEWPELRAAIAALPERQRLVLFLRYYADLDYRGIADAAGIEQGTVAATLHAAHEKVGGVIQEVSR